MLNRLLSKLGVPRETLRIDNCVRCQPPGDWLDGAPWEAGALVHCHQYLGQTLKEGYSSVVALGGSATRKLLQLPRKPFAINDWHGCPTRDPTGRFWVTPTFHPAFLLRGNQKLMGAVMFDLRRGLQVANEGRWEGEPADLVVDPSRDWFERWVQEYLDALREREVWLSVDIETVDKLAGADEGELEDEYSQIVRINFAFHPDQGVTVPWEEAYKGGIRKLLAASGVKCFWNASYDVPRLRGAGMVVAEPVLDFMWAWHVLQSDLPRGLGFVAPFFSRYGAWKHLSGSNPGDYAAIDAVQTLRVAHGVARKLQEQGQWEVFRRHVYELDTKVLHPATEIGLKVDLVRLAAFTVKLRELLAERLKQIQGLVPESCQELHPKGGWTRKPPEGGLAVTYKRGESKLQVEYRDEELITKVEDHPVQLCTACDALGVAKTHRCKDKALTPQVTTVVRPTPRYYVREPFNPGSPQQVLAYLQAKGHKAGKAKKSKSGNPSVDKTTLEKLSRTTRDPFYQALLDYRALDKVKGTYAEGTARRVDAAGRLHTTYTHRPSTLRLSSINPNLTNVVSDRAEKISAGFRECIVAEDEL